LRSLFYEFNIGKLSYVIADPIEKPIEDLAELCCLVNNFILTYFDNALWFIKVSEIPTATKKTVVTYVINPVIFSKVEKFHKYLVISKNKEIYLTNDISETTGGDFVIRIFDESDPNNCLVTVNLIRTIMKLRREG